MMKLQTLTMIASVAFLTSCGVTKTNDTNSTYNYSSSATKVLASCNKAADSNISVSLATMTSSYGTVDYNWTKLKFNFLSSAATASGNTVRFFKWRIVNGQTILDQTALASYSYNLSTGATTGQATNSIATTSISSNQGFYVNLNDSQGSFQALKVVVYSSSGTLVAQKDVLIPQFYARAGDYAYNTDGSVRSTALTSLHPLASTNHSNWSDSQITSYYQQLCF